MDEESAPNVFIEIVFVLPQQVPVQGPQQQAPQAPSTPQPTSTPQQPPAPPLAPQPHQQMQQPLSNSRVLRFIAIALAALGALLAALLLGALTWKAIDAIFDGNDRANTPTPTPAKIVCDFAQGARDSLHPESMTAESQKCASTPSYLNGRIVGKAQKVKAECQRGRHDGFVGAPENLLCAGDDDYESAHIDGFRKRALALNG